MQISLACAQMACRPIDPVSNLRTARRLVEEACARGADLVVLPEYLTTGCLYDRRLREFAEPVGGATTRLLANWSRQHGCWIAAGLPELSKSVLFNTLVLTGPSGEVHSYRKRCPAFFENLYFCRGLRTGLFETPIGRIGVMICWDMVHARLVDELAGHCDLLLICSAWPDMTTGNIPLLGFQGWMSRQPQERPKVLAQQLGVPVVYCNATGPFETRVPGFGLTYRSEFSGQSSITAANGETLASLERQSGIIVAEATLRPQIGSDASVATIVAA